MTNMQRANSTGGAKGPRADEAKANTANAGGEGAANMTPEKMALLMNFEDVPDFTGETDEELGVKAISGNDLHPQERRGLGTNTSVITDRHPNFTPNMTPENPNNSPNGNMFEMYDAAPFEENPRNLPHVPDRPGFKNAWIRWFNEDGSFDKELQQMIRRGYRPVDPANVAFHHRAFILTRPNGISQGDCLTVSGMVLCEIDEALWLRHQQSEKAMHERQERAVLDPVRNANEQAARRGSRGMVIGVEGLDD